MGTGTALQRPALLGLVSAWPQSRFWLLCVDLYPALAAAALPWSTTAVIAFMSVWVVVLLPTIKYTSFVKCLTQPAALFPLGLVGLAILGMLWADDSWSTRIQGLSPVAKLPVIPLLLYHFQRSKRGHWVFGAFLASCSMLAATSWVMYFFPDLTIAADKPLGVPVRNYIDQTLCIFALAAVVVALVTRRRHAVAVACAALLIVFVLNMTFVVLARTAVIYIPVLAALFAVKFLSTRAAICLLVLGGLAGGLIWSTSPYLRWRVERTVHDFKLARDTDIATSNGERLAYWRTSIDVIAKSPIVGHGTGSTKKIFAAAAEGKSGEWANSVRNPHNQILYVSIQWGLIGSIVLLAMWYFHLTLFSATSLFGWIGLTVVVQNFLSSMLNSHLFDFHEGWIYVLGVGVAGGYAIREKAENFHSLAQRP
jgi:O-antigen ligase